MPTSPVAFQDKPDDDVCVQLIGNKQGTHASTTPEEICSIPGGDLSLPNKHPFTIDYKHYQIVFIAPKKKTIRFKFPTWKWFLSHLPLFTMWISLVQIIIFLHLTKKLRQELNFDPKQAFQAYRFFTYMFLHIGALHLALNVLLQQILGTPLEIEQGHLRTALVYIGGGVGGAMGALIVEPSTVVEGASAGVYAILMAQIPHMVLNLEDLRYKISRIVGVVILLFADVGHTIYHISSNGNNYPRISVPAHAFGAVTGVFLGFILFRGTSKWTKIYQILSASFLCVLYSTGVLLILLRSHLLLINY